MAGTVIDRDGRRAGFCPGSGLSSGFENFRGRVPGFEIFCLGSGPGFGFHFKMRPSLVIEVNERFVNFSEVLQVGNKP